MPDRRPRFALPFTILGESDIVRLVAGEDFRYTLAAPGLGNWLPIWLRTLDGTTPVDAAVARLPPEHHAAALQIIEQLYGERAIIDGSAADAHTRVGCRLVIEGNANWTADWEPPKVDDAKPLLAFCQDRLDYAAALEFNRRCIRERKTWFWASTGPLGRAYVSPLFVPHAGPCLSCLFNHFRRLSPAADLYDELSAHARRGGTFAPVPFPEFAIALLRSLLLWKSAQTEESQPPAALYRLHVLEVSSLEITSHRVFVDPECPDCGGRN